MLIGSLVGKSFLLVLLMVFRRTEYEAFLHEDFAPYSPFLYNHSAADLVVICVVLYGEFG